MSGIIVSSIRSTARSVEVLAISLCGPLPLRLSARARQYARVARPRCLPWWRRSPQIRIRRTRPAGSTAPRATPRLKA